MWKIQFSLIKTKNFLNHDAINEEYLKKIAEIVKVLYYIFSRPIRMLVCLGLIYSVLLSI